MSTKLLCIMDGFGLGPKSKGNAVSLASTPVLDKLMKKYPHSQLITSGEEVGLPKGQMGNSEVGHLNIGAGRVVNQMLQVINKSFAENKIQETKEFKDLMNNEVIHLVGLVSDGGVHSSLDHLLNLLDLLKDKTVKIHVITDGRDVSPKSAKKYIDVISNYISSNKHSIATISGRYYAMDRDKRWERVKLAYDAIVLGGSQKIKDYSKFIQEQYNKNIIDEFFEPACLEGYTGMKKGDGVLFFNFRPDRAIQLSSVITNKDYDSRDDLKPIEVNYFTMTPYGDTVKAEVLFKPEEIKNGFGETISKAGLKQLRIAETEKFPHVTFFFDGGKDMKFKGEDRILIPSPKVDTYDLQPEMSANIITDELLKVIDQYDLVILNFANCDMVGHTGNIPATIKAVETVDTCIGRIYDKIQEIGGTMYITADHGNADLMLDETGGPVSKHSTNPVPFIVTREGKKVQNGALCDIAPTILTEMKLSIPTQIKGKNLVD